STATETASITVRPVNDAPVLDNSGDMTLTSISNDPPTNPGDRVSAIIASAGGDRLTDADVAAGDGGAGVGGNPNHGTGEFNTAGGAHWTPFGSPSDTSARLLAANAGTRVRFVPDPSFVGTVSDGLSFRAWDQTSGSNGGTADVTVNGDSTAFSTAAETA